MHLYVRRHIYIKAHLKLIFIFKVAQENQFISNLTDATKTLLIEYIKYIIVIWL